MDMDAGAVVTNLLHDTSLSLGKGDVATRLVADELDLNLATLAIALLIIIVVVVGGRGTLALHTTRFGRGAAIANGLGIVKLGGRGLVVLVGDVCHGVSNGEFLEYQQVLLYYRERDHREWEKRLVEILL